MDSFSCEIYLDRTFTYGEDYKVGDTVTIKYSIPLIDLHIKVDVLIEGAVVFYDNKNNRNVSLVFGKDVKTLSEIIREKTEQVVV